jgi:hypothetical protein
MAQPLLDEDPVASNAAPALLARQCWSNPGEQLHVIIGTLDAGTR